MTPAVWNGVLRFGLLTMPVKLYRAAQAERSASGRYTSKRALASDARCVRTSVRSMAPRQPHPRMLQKPCRPNRSEHRHVCGPHPRLLVQCNRRC
jgi:hypothetical protein